MIKIQSQQENAEGRNHSCEGKQLMSKQLKQDAAEMFWGEEASTSQGMENVLSIKVPVIE